MRQTLGRAKNHRPWLKVLAVDDGMVADTLSHSVTGSAAVNAAASGRHRRCR